SIVSAKNNASLQPTRTRQLNLITCYPFYYVGAAPQRFVVRAQLANPAERPSPFQAPVPKPTTVHRTTARTANPKPLVTSSPAPVMARDETPSRPRKRSRWGWLLPWRNRKSDGPS